MTTENDIRPANPTFRQIDWNAEVKRMYGPHWNEAEDSYRFSNGRKFKLRTGDAYSRVRPIKYASLPGAVGSSLSTGDSDILDIPGDLAFLAYVAMDSWTPVAAQMFIAKFASAGNFSYRFFIMPSGRLAMSVSGDGTAILNYTSVPPVPGVAGQGLWIGGALDVDNGANSVGTLLYSNDPPNMALDKIQLKQLGISVTNAITGVFVGNSVLSIGIQGSTAPLAGKVYSAYVFNGGLNGQPVASMIASDADGSSFVSRATGETWTLNGSASIVVTNEYEVY